MAKILVVDDEEKIAGIFVAFLIKKGFEVIQVSGGEEAIALLKSGVEIDLMILDMKMPKVTGLDVLKARNGMKDTRPVIIVTGSMGQDKTYEDIAEFGFRREDVVYKPVDLFLLLEEIKKRLGMKA